MSRWAWPTPIAHDDQHPDLTTGYHRAPDHDALDAADLLGQDVSPKETADGVNIRGDWLYVGPRAAGAVQSTIHDMAKYAAALLDRSAGIVKPETFDAMVSPQWSPDARLADVGLCFMRQPRFGRLTYGHGGGIAGGWNTHLTVVPEEGLAVLTHLNLSFDGFSEVESAILRAALNAAPLDLQGKPTDAAMLEAAPGVYGPAPGHLTNFRITRGPRAGADRAARRRLGTALAARRMAERRAHGPVPCGRSDVLHTGHGRDRAAAGYAAHGRGRPGERGYLFDRLIEMRRDDSLAPWA